MSALLQKCEQLARSFAGDGEIARVLVEDGYIDGKKPLQPSGLPVRYPRLLRVAKAFVTKHHSSKPHDGDRIVAETNVEYESSQPGAQGRANDEVLAELAALLEQ